METHGAPGEKIVELAKKCDASMIVMGRRGLGAFSSAFLGSVSDHLVQRAPVPVLIVPPAAKGK